MKMKSVLEQIDVARIILAARQEAIENGWAVSICIVDDGGHPLSLVRMDGCAAIGSYIATEKARTAALGQRESKVYEDMINEGRISFVSAPFIKGMLTGGVPLSMDGQSVIGAIGVSGVRPEQDAQIAHAGAAALNLRVTK